MCARRQVSGRPADRWRGPRWQQERFEGIGCRGWAARRRERRRYLPG
jgi:hypothetical protein